jgi:hypothetical protein
LIKIVDTAAHVKSFDVAAHLLQLNAEFAISGRQVNRITGEMGQELRDARDQRTEDYVHHRRPAPPVPAPQKVALGVDGGRMNTREPGHGVGVHEAGWREDKVGCLQILEGPYFTADPHPQPPACFLDKDHVKTMVKDFQQQKGLRSYDAPETPTHDPETSGDGPEPPPAAVAEGLVAAPEPQPVTAAGPSAAPLLEPAPPPLAVPVSTSSPAWPPERLERTCVASMANSHTFAKLLAAEAYARHFFAAEQRAFLGDGLAYNWKIQQQWFPDFTPILDFVHPLSYLYATAGVSSATEEERWSRYVRWMTASWQGEVADVLAELRQEQGRLTEQLGPADGKLPSHDPREVLRKTLNYLENNAPRMNYPRYRQLGLPVTSAAVESQIKEFNYRVKGTEKFWNDPEGAEAILQVRAAALSEDGRLAEHIPGVLQSWLAAASWVEGCTLSGGARAFARRRSWPALSSSRRSSCKPSATSATCYPTSRSAGTSPSTSPACSSPTARTSAASTANSPRPPTSPACQVTRTLSRLGDTNCYERNR